jgi:hypothetical protein
VPPAELPTAPAIETELIKSVVSSRCDAPVSWYLQGRRWWRPVARLQLRMQAGTREGG